MLAVDAPALFVVPITAVAGRWSDSAFALMPGERRRLAFAPADGADCDLDRLQADAQFASLHLLLAPPAAGGTHA